MPLIFNRKALSSYQVEHDAAASIAAIKRIAVVGRDFERHDRFLGIGCLYMLEQQYDSAFVYLNKVFSEAPNLFLRTQSAEYLSEIYDQLGDAQKANAYARFVTQNTPSEFGTKADEWRYTNIFQEYLAHQREQVVNQERRENRLIVLKMVVVLLVLLSILLVLLLIYRHRHKQTEAEKDTLSGQLKENEKVLLAMKKRVEAASFADEPICQRILEVVGEQHFKSKVDYIAYKDYALSKEDLMALREAADHHFGHFTNRLRHAYPAMTKGDVDYCCLYLLGLEEADIAALMQRAYNTVCDRSRKLKALFNDDAPLSETLRNYAHQG